MTPLLFAALLCGVVVSSQPAHASDRVEGIPKLDHVFVIVLENENLAATWYPATPSYLSRLRTTGTFASQYYAASHVSAGNYIAMTSGQMPTAPFQSDCVDWSKCRAWEAARPDGGVSVADQIEGAHETWKAYMDGTPAGGAPRSCMHPAADASVASFNNDPYQSGYATRHDPFVYYPPIVDHTARCDAHVVPFAQLAGDLTRARGRRADANIPNYAFIAPDTCHDAHDSPCTGSDMGEPGWQRGGLVAANLWMATTVPMILRSPAFTTPGVASLLLITTDEAANTDVTGCVTGPPLSGALPGTCASGVPPLGVDGGGLVGLLAIGSAAAQVKTAPAGNVTPVAYDHASMLRTVEDGLRLPGVGSRPGVFEDAGGHLNAAGSPLEHAMAALFTSR